MKKSLLLISLLAIVLLPFSQINAQEASTTNPVTTEINANTTKATNKYFDLTLSEGLQSPLDKSIPYTLTIVPHIDSSQAQILWDSSSTIKIIPKHEQFVNLVKGQSYTYKAIIKPTVYGTYNINVSVIAWQYDTNYTNTVSNALTLSKGLVAQPIPPEYTILVVIEILVLIGIFGLAIWGGIELSKKFMKKTKVWLTPPS